MALLRHMTLVRSALVYKSRRLATRIDNLPGGRKRPLEKGVAMSLSEKSREKLTAVSTATLTTVLFKRGFRNTFIQGIHRLNPGGPAWSVRPTCCATFRHGKTSITSACSKTAAI